MITVNALPRLYCMSACELLSLFFTALPILVCSAFSFSLFLFFPPSPMSNSVPPSTVAAIVTSSSNNTGKRKHTQWRRSRETLNSGGFVVWYSFPFLESEWYDVSCFLYELFNSTRFLVASFTFLFATSRSFPGFAANRRRERRGRSAYIALFFVCCFEDINTQIVQNREEKKGRKERERERESGFVSVVAYVFQPSVRDAFRRDRSIDRTTTTRRSRRRPAR